MRIAYLTAGTAGMYCGACSRDLTVIRGLLKRGHDVHATPLYTPVKIEGREPLPLTDVFLGGINVYLQQQAPLFGQAPLLLRRLLDRPALLNFASRFAVSTRAADLGPMTVSVLSGSEGKQRQELRRLLDFLSREPKPDLVVITNSLLSAVAPEVKRELGAAVVCGLQGEEDFLGQMPEPYRSQGQALLRRHSAAVDLFISPYAAHAEKMAAYLGVAPERIRVVPTALEVERYRHQSARVREPFTVGYLGVITPGKGLDLLVEAWIRLVREQNRAVRLRVAGKVLDKAYWRAVRARIRAAGLVAQKEYLGEVDFERKRQFLRSLSVLCQPSRFPEARGLVAMEAMASGVPVVVPRRGVFPEMMGLTGGGLMVEPENPSALAEALARLQDNPEQADRLGQQGAQAIARHYAADQVVERTLAVFEEAVRLARPT